MSRYRIGVDVGGTFTDFVLLDLRNGLTSTLKTLTTPQDPSLGIVNGLRTLGVDLADVAGVAHGTTTATNALIERDGAKTAFLTTAGFRDTLEVRRTNRQELYDGQWFPPLPLVPRRNRIEIHERLMWDGQVARALDEDEIRDVAETLRVRDIEAVAVCFLHAYQHPKHEVRVKEILKEELPGVYITASHEVSQEFREFERGSTVAANAFVGPKVQSYITNLQLAVGQAGLTADVAIMQSNGGVCTPAEASTTPVRLARSGPAGGAMALQRLSELTGIGELVGVDIGGTSADVSLVVDGHPRWASPLLVEWGMPLLFPSVDVVSIGAGGGSIAWIDDAGVMHMGPQSAGADPGPAAYGRGGERATSTDAHVVLGRVSPTRFMEGHLPLDAGKARDAIQREVAEPLELETAEAAEGMLRVLDNAMIQAVRFVTVEKGYDPRDFVLVGLGGGGPLHAVALARELGMNRAIVPLNPGVLSAWGMLTVDMVQDRSRTLLKRRKAIDTTELSNVLAALRADILEAFSRQEVSADRIEWDYVLDLQYYGQVFSMAVPLGGPLGQGRGADDIRVSEEGVLSVPLGVEAEGLVTESALEAAVELFHHEHEREYGHSDREQEVQVVHGRVFGRVAVQKPALITEQDQGADPSDALVGTREVVFDGSVHEAAVFDRLALQAGNRISGPAVIDEMTSTTALPPGSYATVDEYGNLLIDTGV